MTRYYVTEQQVQKYSEEPDGLTAIEILGVEKSRFTNSGLKRSDGSTEPYECFHQRVADIFRDGHLWFEL